MSRLRGHFYNTRPLDRAASLTARLRAADWQVTELPLLELVPLALAGSDLQALQQLAYFPTVVVVVSPTAATLGLSALQQLGLVPTRLAVRWLAVGEGTAQVLRAAGIDADLPAESSSEGLMATALLAGLESQDRVMVWRGIGGRELVQERLLARGVQLQVLNLYQRQMPKTSQQLWVSYGFSDKLALDVKKNDSLRPTVVLLSSGESWRHWQKLAAEHALDPWLLVLGPRLMDELQCVTTRVKAITSLQPEHILTALTEIENT